MRHGLLSTPTVLLVSDDSRLVALMQAAQSSLPELQQETCTDSAQALARVEDTDVGLVVLHVEDGMDPAQVKELMHVVSEQDHPIATVLILDESFSNQKREFLRAGAACCLPTIVSAGKLAHVISSLTFQARSQFESAVGAGEDEGNIGDPDPSYYLFSPEMVQLMGLVRRMAGQEATVLFTGETGTGKTRLARVMHEMSPRRNGPFLVVDCNSLAPSLIESELFGHVRGAFTGADRDRAGKFVAAGKGTLVLDEINSLPLQLQSKLLRVVDDRVFEPVGSEKSQPMRARLVAISNANLEQEVAAGRFRGDLYHRLNVVGFHLPPLRERSGAIEAMAKRFLAQCAGEQGIEKAAIAPDALLALERYSWPGNIRELANVIKRAVTLFPGHKLQLRDLPEALRSGDGIRLARPMTQSVTNDEEPMPPMSPIVHEAKTLMKTKENAEILCITEALRKNRNNRRRTAADLGISRMALYKKLRKYNLYNINSA